MHSRWRLTALRRMANQPVTRHTDDSALKTAFSAGTNDRSTEPPGEASRRRMKAMNATATVETTAFQAKNVRSVRSMALF